MAQVHVARVGLFTVDQTGTRLDKCCPTTSINDLKNTRQEFLVLPDAGIPNSAGYPTLKAFLEAEAAAGFVLNHLDQSFAITYST
jgi:hypothetical protein